MMWLLLRQTEILEDLQAFFDALCSYRRKRFEQQITPEMAYRRMYWDWVPGKNTNGVFLRLNNGSSRLVREFGSTIEAKEYIWQRIGIEPLEVSTYNPSYDYRPRDYRVFPQDRS